MGADSKIQWTDHTFNPWRGCVKVSPGCAHCYAEVSAPARIARAAGVETWGKDALRIPGSEAMWREPEKWNRRAEKAGVRARVFCASLADVFEDRRDLDPHRARLFDLIRRTPWLDWQLLTKRPENIATLLKDAAVFCERASGGFDDDWNTATWLSRWVVGHAPSNVWIGTTAEDQQRADERIAYLLRTPAVVRFLSVEPMLGPVQLGVGSHFFDYGVGLANHNNKGAGLHWVIVGGESGPRARPFDIAWARSIVAQCHEADVPCFVKQIGSEPVDHDGVTQFIGGSLIRDRKGGDMDEWPEDLRVRQMPTSKAEVDRNS